VAAGGWPYTSLVITAKLSPKLGVDVFSEPVFVRAQTAMRLSVVEAKSRLLRKNSPLDWNDPPGGTVAGWIEKDNPPNGTRAWEASTWTTGGRFPDVAVDRAVLDIA